MPSARKSARKSTSQPPPPPLRADAARNRGLVLDAAAAVFADGGPDSSTEEIARRAGVGVGTVFRHFPTKEMLLGAVLEQMFEGLAEIARQGLDANDVELGFFLTLHRLVDGAAAKMAVADALSRAGGKLRYSSWAEPLREALADLLSRAHAAGALREDVGVAELMAVLIAASRAAQFAGKDRGFRKRVVSMVLDGLQRAGSSAVQRRDDSYTATSRN
jgi:AcrR family transcriptional regulator